MSQTKEIFIQQSEEKTLSTSSTLCFKVDYPFQGEGSGSTCQFVFSSKDVLNNIQRKEQEFFLHNGGYDRETPQDERSYVFKSVMEQINSREYKNNFDEIKMQKFIESLDPNLTQAERELLIKNKQDEIDIDRRLTYRSIPVHPSKKFFLESLVNRVKNTEPDKDENGKIILDNEGNPVYGYSESRYDVYLIVDLNVQTIITLDIGKVRVSGHYLTYHDDDGFLREDRTRILVRIDSVIDNRDIYVNAQTNEVIDRNKGEEYIINKEQPLNVTHVYGKPTVDIIRFYLTSIGVRSENTNK